MGRLAEEPPLGIASVDREDRPPPAALDRPIAIAAVRQEERAVRPEERAKLPLDRVGRSDRAFLQQPGEIVLGQVERSSAPYPWRRISAYTGYQ